MSWKRGFMLSALLASTGCGAGVPGGQSGTEHNGGAGWAHPGRALVFEASPDGFTMSSLDTPFTNTVAVQSVPLVQSDDEGAFVLPRVFANATGDRAVLFMKDMVDVDTGAPRVAVEVTGAEVLDISANADNIDVAWSSSGASALVAVGSDLTLHEAPSWSATTSANNSCVSTVALAWVIESDGTQLGFCGTEPMRAAGGALTKDVDLFPGESGRGVDGLVGTSGRAVFFIAVSAAASGFDVYRVFHEANDTFTTELAATSGQPLSNAKDLIAASEDTVVWENSAGEVYAAKFDGANWTTEQVVDYPGRRAISAIGDDPQILASSHTLNVSLPEGAGVWSNDEITTIGGHESEFADPDGSNSGGCSLAAPSKRISWAWLLTAFFAATLVRRLRSKP